MPKKRNSLVNDNRCMLKNTDYNIKPKLRCKLNDWK